MGRLFRFGLVGLSGVIVDMTVIYVLHDPRLMGWSLNGSKAVAAELAIVNNFLWNDRWTFGDIARMQRGFRNWIGRLLKFNAICLVGLGLNVLLLNLFTRGLHLYYLLANLLAIAVVMFWNFGVNRTLNWRSIES